MSISKYETLAKVCELGSLTKAAEALGCTQSAVSHTINSLEEQFGFAILTRSRAGVRLTDDGERIMPSVRGMLNYYEQLNQTVSAIRGLDFGTVRIGAFTSVAVHWLPGVIKEFQRDYPNVDIKLLNGDYHDVEKWITDGSVDLGFVNLPAKLGCECIALMEDRLLAILPPDHKFASYPKFPLVECETEAFITLLETSNHDANKALSAAGIKPNIKFSTKDDYAIIAMVEQGLGISIMPELLLRGRHDNVAIKELVPPSKRTIGLAIGETSSQSPATRKFADYIIKWVKEKK
ncbi:MAG: LysR family transcriptional regulator [Oscillospiraceae bacterium]|nr:LysR family transcriptional regulator [Oscillospiraceae bacterium]